MMNAALTTTAGGIGQPPQLLPDLELSLFETPRRLRRYRLALGLYVMSIVMLFVGLSSAYIVRRGIATYNPGEAAYSTNWEPLDLPVRLLSFNTLLLIGASACIEVCRRRERPESRYIGVRTSHFAAWLWTAFLLSLAFLIGQGAAWQWLRSGGHLLTSGPRGAFFYVLTATHALHATIAVAAIAFVVLLQGRWSMQHRFMAVDLAAWYLHSTTALWICLFAFLVFA